MKKVLAVLALSALGSMLSSAAEFTGYISDAKCATSGASKKTAAEWIKPAAFEQCVKQCVKDGSEVVFVTEDNKIVKIDAASMDKVMPVLGHKVTVNGKVEGNTLKIDSISSLKM